ncbi:MAG: phosphoribosyltransferase domain-containing protein [Verrucomicrobiae bacterium]|nr:phosphoribosyltransferase domain-containing protein [Verrucomicrobiae bacterium]
MNPTKFMRIRDSSWKKISLGLYEVRLGDALFSFRLDSEKISLPSLIDVALRNNRKRRFLFVSKVIGRHLPTRPQELRRVAVDLATQLRKQLAEKTTVFFGMSETATTIGQAVFREWRLAGGTGIYLESTRHRTNGEVAFSFSEDHSHASQHLIHLPDDGGFVREAFCGAPQMVIVDDEATTGNTALSLANAYNIWRTQNQFPSARPNLAVILKLNSSFHSLDSFDTVASLARGESNFQIESELGDPPAPQKFHSSEAKRRKGVRHGTESPETLPDSWESLRPEPGERILVLGTGEYGFQPLLLAEYLEKLGGNACLQSTTRSPILGGGAIAHVRSFPAFTGDGFTEHLYNVPDDHSYDRILLCVEGEPPQPHHPIWDVPRIHLAPKPEPQ